MGKRHRNLWFFKTQFITALLSTAMVLILLGAVVLFMLTASNLSSYVRENISIEILLADDATSGDIMKMQKFLNARPYVKSLEYVSKEKAVKEQVEEMGIDPKEFLGYNPFIASFEINVTAEYANNDSLAMIEKEVKSADAVMGVEYQKELIDAVNSNIKKISIVMLIIAALFTYISFALINNTVKLSIFSSRFKINTMKLVGASWSFIRRPFMHKALALGICSAVFADALMWGGMQWLVKFEPTITMVIDWKVLVITGASVVVFGLLITILCTYFSLWKYLRMSSNALYRI